MKHENGSSAPCAPNRVKGRQVRARDALPWLAGVSRWKAGLIGAMVFGGATLVAQVFGFAKEGNLVPPRGSALAATHLSKPVSKRAVILDYREQEPNNSLKDARRMTLSSTVAWTLAGRVGPGDVDVYGFKLKETSGHRLNVRLDPAPDGPLTFDVFAKEKRKAHVAGPGSLVALGVDGTLYRIEVRPGSLEAKRTVRYKLVVELVAAGRDVESEPNGAPEHAGPVAVFGKDRAGFSQKRSKVSFGKEIAWHGVRGWWSASEDVDCFEIPLQVPNEGALIQFELQPPRNALARLQVFDGVAPPTELMAAVGSAPGQTIVVPALGARSWQHAYKVCVSAQEGFLSGAPYQLEARLIVPSRLFEFEPNQGAKTSSALALDAGLDGFLVPGDVDWFRLGSARGLLELRLPEPIQAKVVFLDASSKEVVMERHLKPGAHSLSFKGATYVRIAEVSGGHSTTSYRAQIHRRGVR